MRQVYFDSFSRWVMGALLRVGHAALELLCQHRGQTCLVIIVVILVVAVFTITLFCCLQGSPPPAYFKKSWFATPAKKSLAQKLALQFGANVHTAYAHVFIVAHVPPVIVVPVALRILEWSPASFTYWVRLLGGGGMRCVSELCTP